MLPLFTTKPTTNKQRSNREFITTVETKQAATVEAALELFGVHTRDCSTIHLFYHNTAEGVPRKTILYGIEIYRNPQCPRTSRVLYAHTRIGSRPPVLAA